MRSDQVVQDFGDFEENPSMLIVNPSRRRRKKVRKMSALQRKYFGKGRKRRAGGRKRRGKTITIHSNPSRRSRRRRSGYRRNPIAGATMRANLGTVTGAVGDAAIGAGGAIAVDILMGQAARVLPATMTTQYRADGALNLPYVATKAGVALGLGILGARFLPGRMRGWAARAAVGSLTVQGYQLARTMLPPELTLGYYNPARVARNGMAGRGGVGKLGYYMRPTLSGRGMGASFPHGSVSLDYKIDNRVGESDIEA